MVPDSGSSPAPDGPVVWQATGDGQPLILINGYGGTAADWDPGFLEHLGAHSRVICPDNRGLGATPPPADGTGEMTVERLAADVVALMDDLGIDRAPVAGWSMGGFIAQTLAANHPDRVEALVLLGSSPGGELAVTGRREDFLALIDSSGTPRERASRLIGLLFPEPTASQVDAQFGDIVAEAQAALDPTTLQAQQGVMAKWHTTPCAPRLERIKAPTLCAHGNEDVVIPAANTDALTNAIPGAWKALFPGVGHALMAMEPARLAALIAVFLGR